MTSSIPFQDFKRSSQTTRLKNRRFLSHKILRTGFVFQVNIYHQRDKCLPSLCGHIYGPHQESKGFNLSLCSRLKTWSKNGLTQLQSSPPVPQTENSVTDKVSLKKRSDFKILETIFDFVNFCDFLKLPTRNPSNCMIALCSI